MKTRLLAALGAAAVAVSGLAVSSPAQAAPSPGADAGLFFPTSSARVWDTRANGSKLPMSPDSWLKVKVTGVGNIPASGVSAVTMNLTVAAASADGYLTVYPSGAAKPNASSINFKAGDVRANTVTMPVGADGSIMIFNRTGKTHLAIDLTGFYAKDNSIAASYGPGSGLLPIGTRIIDSRSGTPLAPGETRKVKFHQASSITPTERALYLNVTVPAPTGNGWLRVWNGTGAPNISTVNFKAGMRAVANTTATGLWRADDNSTTFSITNHSSKPTNFIVDVLATYDMSIWDTKYVPYGPTRVLDTRTGIGGAKAKIGENVNRAVTLPAALRGANTYAIVGNAVLLNATLNDSWMRVWDNDPPAPGVSTVNADWGQVLANGVVTATNFQNGGIAVYNRRGSIDAIVDVNGMFQFDGVAVPAALAKMEAKAQQVRLNIAAVQGR